MPAKRRTSQPVAAESLGNHAEWFILIGNKEAGPYTIDEIKAMAVAGTLRPATPVRRQGFGWGYAQDYAILVNIIAGSAPPDGKLTVDTVSPSPRPPVSPPSATTLSPPSQAIDVRRRTLFRWGIFAAFSQRPLIVPALLAALMLIGALGSWRYWYFNALRWIICGIAIAFVAYAYSVGRAWASWVFGALAILFNPIVPVHLSRKTWPPIDVAAAIVFVVGAVLVKGRSGSEKMDKK